MINLGADEMSSVRHSAVIEPLKMKQVAKISKMCANWERTWDGGLQKLCHAEARRKCRNARH